MFGLLKSFILSNFIWVLLASSVASGFASGLIVHKWHRASELSELKQALEKREANDEKTRKVRIVVDSLPDGAAAQRLFFSWNRNAD